MKMNRSKKGFTLVEIMIVVVIIGLLAALAIPAFNKVRATSQDKYVANALRQIAGAADQYFMETGANSVNLSALYGNSMYIAGNFSTVGPTAANPTFLFATDPITTTLSVLSGADIAGSGRSVVHYK